MNVFKRVVELGEEDVVLNKSDLKPHLDRLNEIRAFLIHELEKEETPLVPREHGFTVPQWLGRNEDEYACSWWTVRQHDLLYSLMWLWALCEDLEDALGEPHKQAGQLGPEDTIWLKVKGWGEK